MAAAESDELEEVSVTGTRIRQPTDYVSPNPLVSLDAEEMERLAINYVGEAIRLLPQNLSQFTPANANSGGFYFVGSTLANLRGLNPYFGTRTLTLVNSRRHIPTTQGDAVDLGFIPTNLLSRMEVITGGASAAYGSGAIAGAVNLIMDTHMEGLRLDLDYGVTGEGDGENYGIGVAGGFSFAGGRGRVVAGGQFQDSQAIVSCTDARDWCANSPGLYLNSNRSVPPGTPQVDPATGAVNWAPAFPGQPYFMLMPDLRWAQLSRGGVIVNARPGATGTSQFNDAGNDVLPLTFGQEAWRAPGGFAIGGDGEALYKYQAMYPDMQRQAWFTHGEFDFTERLTGYFEASWGSIEARIPRWQAGVNSTFICIRPDNAFLGTLSAEARAALAASVNNAIFATMPNQTCGDFTGGALPFLNATVITKNWQGQASSETATDTRVARGVLGLGGRMGELWNWDAYYQYGRTVRDQQSFDMFTNWRYTMALDSIADPRPGPGFGRPICRAIVAGVPDAPFFRPPLADPSLVEGCQPLNPFGITASPEALAYAFGDLTEHDNIDQHVIAATMSGQLWRGWGAGPLQAAFGIEWRREELTNDAGDLPDAQRTDFLAQYGDSFGGRTEVWEAFAEFEMPLLADRPFARLLMLNAAVRTARYETTSFAGLITGTNAHEISSWKVATVWEPTGWLRFRGSRSRDLRAPNFRESFFSLTAPAGGVFGTVQNPWIDISLEPPPQTNIEPAVWWLTGNPALRPEEATTSTIGFVISPRGGASGLRFSTDYYRIKLKDGISLTLGGQDAINRCFLGEQEMCRFIEFGTPNPTQATNPDAAYTNIARYISTHANSATYEAQGLDFSLDYRLPLDTLFQGAGGEIALSLLASHMAKLIVPTGTTTSVDMAGQTGGNQGFLPDYTTAPDWAGNVTLSYLNGPFTASIQARYVSAGTLDQQNPKTGPDSPDYDPTISYSITDNTIPSYLVFSLNGAYDFNWFGLERTQFFVSVNNLFDKVPPYSSGATGGINAMFFDVMGRSFRVGLRLQL